MDQENHKLNLNPLFKKQLFLLKTAAKNEFNIHISIDKMAHDKQYRNTVFDELNELGSEKLNQHLHILKRIPVYLKSVSEPFSLEHLPTPKGRKKSLKKEPVDEPDKKSFRTLFLICFALLIFSLFFAWRSNYLQPILQPNVAIAKQVVDIKVLPLPATKPVLSTASVTKKRHLTLPSAEKTVSLRLHGSNTVGENLAPALLEAYLKSTGIKEMLWVQGESRVERELQYIENNHIYAIELQAHGSSTGFKDLLNNEADMGMSSRKIKNKENELLRPLYGELAHSAQELIIGLDGLAIIVNSANPITKLTTKQLAKIFSGETDNWSALGGNDLPIHLYTRDENSGTWDTFKNLVLKSHHKKLYHKARRFESSNELSERVSQDISAIGFIALPYVNNSKALAIAASQQTSAIYPTRFTVSTEDYPLSRRLYMYAPSIKNKIVKDFSNFVISHAGQKIVEEVGLVSQNIKLEKIYQVKDAPQIYNDYAQVASRLSVNFRFKSASNELDSKGERDLIRLMDYMAENQGRRIVLMGFSDATGSPWKNIKLSRLRANVLEQELIARGLNVVAVEGLGAQLPVASNRTALGRRKNRRVEVWFF